MLEPLAAVLQRAGAVGHRVVHGGPDLREATVLDAGVVAQIEALTPLARLHQPRAVAGIRAVEAALPHVPAVACFDTAFHATLPPAAATYALPQDWRRRWPLRRFGFHGLSHQYAVRRATELLGRLPPRMVACHLGAGASLCAVLDGRSVDTTMGFTPLEGLVMNTRSGSLDPGLVLWLIEEAGLAPAEVTDGLERRSGLSGLSGTSGDLRGIGAGTLAFAVYIHRLRREVAAMVAALGGLDALVFTGGVGEHQPAVRAAAAAGLGFLGVAIDDEQNAAMTGDGEIGAAGAPARTLVVTAREDLEISRQVRERLA
ncbi:MAG TPA: acetate/propionate family kinase [Acidimicrobiales bacterium]|nr:acetate/propionate family kinase [Acidimicrobiales bacterium]